jgi:hypothetical protein
VSKSAASHLLIEKTSEGLAFDDRVKVEGSELAAGDLRHDSLDQLFV